MRNFVLTILVILNVVPVFCAPQFMWVKHGARKNDNNGVYTDGAIALDASGNIYIGGYYYAQPNSADAITFDGIELQGYSLGSFQDDIFFAKYNNSGTIQWALRAGSTSSFERCKGVAIDGGYVYYTGEYANSFYYGSTNSGVTSYGGSDVFIAKYTTGGSFVRVVHAGTTSSDRSGGIVVVSGGAMYITGTYIGTATFGSLSITSSLASNDVFIARYDTAGVCQWVRSAGGTAGVEEAYGIAADASGNVYICGIYSSTATFGSYSVTSVGGSDVFLAKYNSSGTCQWVRSGGSTAGDVAYCVAVDGSGNCYIVGYYGNANCTFSGTTLNTIGGSSDVFVCKYNTSGTLQWARRGGSAAGSDAGYGIAVDGKGNVYATGYFSNTATFETSSITSAGDLDIFFAAYDASGTLLYLKRAGGTTQAWGKGIATDSEGYVYCTGTIWGVVPQVFNFDSYTLNANRNSCYTGKIDQYFVDIGLRIYDGTTTVPIGCEQGTATSRLRIAEGGVVYGIGLVDTTHPSATRIRIKVPEGVRALRKFN